MITVRRATERAYQKRINQEAWLTFSESDTQNPLLDGFGALQGWTEGKLPPKTGTLQPRKEAEVITYVCEGTVAYEDSTGQTGLLRSGEFQRMTAAPGVRYTETNASSAHWAHVFQIWLRSPEVRLTEGHEQRRFGRAERRGELCIVASPDARKGSLRLHQDAYLYSGLLEKGQHAIHELAKGRSAWLHIVTGEATVGAVTMGVGDGAGFVAERAVSLTVSQPTEILLLDIKAPAIASH